SLLACAPSGMAKAGCGVGPQSACATGSAPAQSTMAAAMVEVLIIGYHPGVGVISIKRARQPAALCSCESSPRCPAHAVPSSRTLARAAGGEPSDRCTLWPALRCRIAGGIHGGRGAPHHHAGTGYGARAEDGCERRTASW